MSIALALVAGMFVGSVLVLVMGALAAASKTEDRFQAEIEREANRRYIELLEQELIRKELGDL